MKADRTSGSPESTGAGRSPEPRAGLRVTKSARQRMLVELVRAGRIESQAALRDALLRQGVSVAQPTVSRDVRELGLVKAHTTDGGSHYIVPADNASDQLPPLEALAPTLIRGVDGVGNLVVLHTVSGAAQTVAAALDDERRPEVMGTLAGDDTVLVVVRTHGAMRELAGTIRELATT